ncbi:unnamed protein product [marine sediment metagenome]|uniref:Uncharacterized protein n=1 Tax=marine sediment metagenome TaxID=412755 RepID=X1EE55_9ZZZZ
MKKAKIRQTSKGCPSQWEGYTDKHEPVYIRYRWGYLSVGIDGKEIIGKNIGDEFDGILSLEELKKELEGKLDVEEIT